ncbi:MAG: hypothetical protein EXR43_00580 [Dehalococcoidia bacterium]|nr:hypothetical protein [Dehalococcoidia bacterium]
MTQGGGPFDRILKKPSEGGRTPPATPLGGLGRGGGKVPRPAPTTLFRRSPDVAPEPGRRPSLDRPGQRKSGGGPLPGAPRAPYVVGAIIIVFGLLLWIAFLPPFTALGGGGQSGFDLGSGIRAVPQDKLPAVPDGLTPVSQFFEIRAPENIAIDSITIDLNGRTQDGANLGFYTFDRDVWRRLQRAELVQEGEAVRGEFTALPKNLAVMRNVNFGFVVSGWLPAGKEVEANAVSLLTVLNPIDYHPDPTGSVSGAPSRVTNVGQFAIAPTISVDSKPDIDALNTIMRSPQLITAHVNAIGRLVDEGGYIGIDLDYRRLDPSLGSQFSEFASQLASRLHSKQKTLSLTLRLPIRDRETWDTGPFNWKQLGEVADQVRVPAISDQSIYAARMEDVLKFATTEVTAKKLLLVVTPYSSVRAGDSITPLSLAQALALGTEAGIKESGAPLVAGGAVTLVAPNLSKDRKGSGIRWDDEANASTFFFEKDGKLISVWLEDQFSLAFKMQLVRKYKLGGVAVLDVSTDKLKADIWPSIRSVVDGGTIRLLKPNPELLQPAWEIADPSGAAVAVSTLQPQGDGATRWQIPNTAGTYTATLIVSNGDMRVGQKVRISVSPRG